MKTKLKVIFIILIIIMMVGMLSTTVKGAYSATVEMKPEKTEVKPGDTVKVVINLIDVTDSIGTDTLEGNVEYDNNFFEEISAATGSWMNNGGAFNLITSGSGAGLTEDGEFAVLQLKVSEKATGSSTVKFTGIKTTDGPGISEPQDITLTFTVSEEEQPEDPNSVDPNGTQGGNNDNDKDENDIKNGLNSIKGNSNNGAGSSGGTSKSKLPDAGWGKGILIGAGILIIITAGSYFLYKRYQKI